MKYNLIAQPKEHYSPMQQILVNRGIQAKEIERYLKTTDIEIINVLNLDNVELGAERLLLHMRDDHDALIQVDSDCDGYTASATLINYLYKVNPQWVINHLEIRVHDGKEHGVVLESVDYDRHKLVIIPDAGSNQYEEHKALKEKGIDVLVLDHHEADKVSEDAIVINNQLSPNYENKALSGVGIVYKFCCLLDEILQIEEADKGLDLVALGMIADMMDLRAFETRHLITKGLTNIRNPFFQGLIERQSYSLGGSITPIGVAFYIAPLINATIRVGTQTEKEIMFKAMLNHMAYEQIPSTKRGCKGKFETVLEQAVRNGTNVRNRQKRTRDAGMAEVERIIQEQGLEKNKVILVETTDILDKNLTGLVANQIMAKYQKPTLLLRRVEDEDGVVTLQGSGRGYDKSELSDLKEFLHQSKYFDYTEGHANAFGAGLQERFVDEFIEYANHKLASYDFTACYDVDFIYIANDFKAQDIIDIGTMKSLWGKGIDESHIVIKGIKVTKENITLMSRDKNPTLKIVLPNGVSLIKFGSSEEEYKSLYKKEGFIEIDVIGTCAINEWMGNITPQVLVKELEVIGQQEYYF